jgi:hypothetical protein
MKADFLPSILQQGTYNHHLYSLGQFDSGMGFYANKQYLREAGVRIPTIAHPWTLTELTTALARLKHVPGVEYRLDLKMNYGYGDGEWFTCDDSTSLTKWLLRTADLQRECIHSRGLGPDGSVRAARCTDFNTVLFLPEQPI